MLFGFSESRVATGVRENVYSCHKKRIISRHSLMSHIAILIARPRVSACLFAARAPPTGVPSIARKKQSWFVGIRRVQFT